MSDTPETDDLAKSIDQSNFEDSWKDDFEEFAWVPAEFSRKLECERDEAREAIQNLKLQLALWEDGNLISEETLGEIRLLNVQINGAFRERDAAHKIAERAIDDLAWFNETNAQRLRAELDQLKEGAK
jgi:hypothetical protein